MNKGKKKVRSVEAPILPPPARCPPFLERGAPLPVDVLCKEGYHREFTYLLGGYLPVDSPPLFYGGALRIDRVLQSAYSRVLRPRRWRRH